MKVFASLGIALIFALSLFAQDKSVTAEVHFNSLNQPVTKSLPVPEYPEIANLAGFGGRITVGVTLDEKGNVIATDDPEGPYPICQSVTELKVTTLRNAAKMAAATAQFGLPVQTVGNIKGVIAYDFMSNHKVELRKIYTVGAKPADESSTGATRMVMSGTAAGQVPDANTGASNVKSAVETPAKIVSDTKTVSGGVLNGTAMTLTKPAYPAAAKALRAGGAVNVQVMIDENGDVNSAAAVSGHPLLRRNSEIAALQFKIYPNSLT